MATDGQEALPVKTELSPMPPTPSGFLLLERSDGVRNSDLHEEATSADATAAAAPLKFWEFSTPYGRCYDLVTSGLSFRSGEFISILFNTSSLGDRKLEVYLYEHGEIGLMGNHWVSNGLTTLPDTPPLCSARPSINYSNKSFSGQLGYLRF